MIEVIQDTLKSVGAQPEAIKILVDSVKVNLLTDTNKSVITFKDLIPVISALIVVFVGSLIQYTIAQKQIRNAIKLNLATLREKWVGELRDRISEYLTNCETLSMFQGKQDIKTILEKIYFSRCKIELLVNPNETDHQVLVQKIYELFYAIIDDIKDNKSTHEINAEIRKEIIELSQKVLKKEWERVREIEQTDI